ncbi:MAG: phospholipid scramblase-related protein [Planctomycetota bacterium]
MKKCPKCRYVFQTFDSDECPRCNELNTKQEGAAFSNDSSEVSPEPRTASPSGTPPGNEDPLNGVDTLMINQKKEMGEVLLGFETKNSYVVRDKTGRQMFMAKEEEQSSWAWVIRIFLSAMRPFKVRVATNMGVTYLWLQRPFRFIFHKLDISDGKFNQIGTIQKQFSILRRIYKIYNEAGVEEFELFGPLLKPWTFFIRREEEEIGKITKQWSGLLKESFTSADNFGATFPADLTSKQKSLLLGATILIDFVHFEKKN